MQDNIKNDENLSNQTKRKIRKTKSKSECFKLSETIVIVVITAIISFSMGLSIKMKNQDINIGRYEKELLTNYQYILNNYYKNVEARDLVAVAIKGMIDYLDDPYSDYIDSEQLDNFNMLINGEYEGIGIQVGYNNDDEPIVAYVFKDSPASMAGLQSDDVIVAINDTNVLDKTLEEIKNMITNFEDEEFNLTFRRQDKENTVKIKKSKITIDSVKNKIYERNNKKIGYLDLDNFAANSYEQFNEELLKLEEDNIDSLIIDLRDNTGGQLGTVDSIVSLFIKKNEVIYQMKEKEHITKYYSNGDKGRKYPIVVLTNENSASASELMAGALKEVYGATTIGVKTYGKGTAQKVITLDNGEQYKFTTKEWLTANGNSIDNVGIEPNIEVFEPDEYYENPKEENDKQLQTAIDFLCK